MAKLLLVAPTCDGEDVGEAWVAYQWARGLAARHEVTLLTYHKRGRTPASKQLDGLRVIEWQEPAVFGRAERFNSMLKPGYVPFYFRALRWIRRSLAAGETYDVGHQVVPVAMRYPSPLAKFDIPYLIGPVGGSLESPPGFAEDDTAPWFVGLRALDRTRRRHDRQLRATYHRAACVLGIAPYVEQLLAGQSIQRFVALSETAIDHVEAPIDRHERTGEVRLLFVGRLIRTKGARDAIQAMALLGDLQVSLDIVGDGFDRAACEALTAELRLGDRIRFHGAQPHSRVAEYYANADVFMFPSYREPGGNVAFEAMAAGLPLVVSDRGGPANVVDDSCGFRVPALTPAQYADALAGAIRKLVDDPTLRLSMGAAARERVAEIGLWEPKFERVDAIYDELIQARRSSR